MVPGASAVFRGAIVAYDNALKTSLLGVDPALLREHGAVSEETALAMARGAREVLGCEVALATTGIAGPTGATEGKPVGLVWLAVADANGATARRTTWPGSRDDVRRRSVTAALNLAWRHLEKEESQPASATKT
jgi:PncC family amidohydrolase